MDKKKMALLLVIALLAVAVVGLKYVSAQKQTNNPLAKSDTLDEFIDKGQPVLLLMHSTTCQSCIEMEKIFKALEPEFKGKVAFVEVDVSDPNQQDMLIRYPIQLIPTTILIDSKGVKVFEDVGVIPEKEMRIKLNKLVGE